MDPPRAAAVLGQVGPSVSLSSMAIERGVGLPLWFLLHMAWRAVALNPKSPRRPRERGPSQAAPHLPETSTRSVGFVRMPVLYEFEFGLE